jgi:hypothetical protein
MTPSLTKSDLETPRHADDLYEWVRHIHAEYGKTKEGRDAMRLHRQPCLKKLCEEVWPLANYAKLFFEHRSGVTFVSVIGNQPCDAFLREDESGEIRCYFEISQALHGESGDPKHPGYQERLRMEHLCQEGHVQQTGRPLTRDPRTKRVVKQEPEADIAVDRVAQTVEAIRLAIQAKAEKRYPPNTVLIVEFDESLLQHQEGHREKLDAAARSELCALASGFSELALVAESGCFGFHYPNPGTPATP